MGDESMGPGVEYTTPFTYTTYSPLDADIEVVPVSLQLSLLVELTAVEVGLWWLLFLLASGYAWRRWSTKTR